MSLLWKNWKKHQIHQMSSLFLHRKDIICTNRVEIGFFPDKFALTINNLRFGDLQKAIGGYGVLVWLALLAEGSCYWFWLIWRGDWGWRAILYPHMR